MADRKPHFKHVNQRSDLDDLIAGDKVNIDRGWPDMIEVMVYEGIIGGKECFIKHDTDHNSIVSWRSERKHLRYKKGTVVFHWLHVDGTTYRPSKYDKAKKMLEQAGMGELK